MGFKAGEFPYISSDNQAAQLVDDKHVERGGRLAEFLLQDLQNWLHHLWGVPQGHCDVSQGSDGVVGNQVSIPMGGKNRHALGTVWHAAVMSTRKLDLDLNVIRLSDEAFI